MASESVRKELSTNVSTLFARYADKDRLGADVALKKIKANAKNLGINPDDAISMYRPK